MLSVEARNKRVKKNYRLENVRLHGKRLREPREHVSFTIKQSTVELNQWLAEHGWAPPAKCNGGRAIDFYVRRFYWLFVTPRKWPDPRRSTLDILNVLVEICKKGGVRYFPDIELQENPNKCRMLDYLAAFWYTYEGGLRSTY